jgi:hypothetical protein
MDGFTRMDGAMPEPRSGAGISRARLETQDQLFQRFMLEFGGGRQQEFTSPVGHPLLIDQSLFRQRRRNAWKIQKGERAEWLVHMAESIKAPDEIWLLGDSQSSLDNLCFLSRFDVGRRQLLGCVAVFERERGQVRSWTGVTSYAATRKQSYWEGLRGRPGQSLVYRRDPARR